MGVTVRAPDGRVWSVRRRIGWPHLRWSILDWSQDLPWLWVDGGVALIVISFVLLAATAVLLPFLVFGLEGLVAVLAILLLLRPWEVEAQTSGPPEEHRTWQVRGWRRSRGAVEEVARELALGVEAEPEHAEPAPSWNRAG